MFHNTNRTKYNQTEQNTTGQNTKKYQNTNTTKYKRTKYKLPKYKWNKIQKYQNTKKINRPDAKQVVHQVAKIWLNGSNMIKWPMRGIRDKKQIFHNTIRTKDNIKETKYKSDKMEKYQKHKHNKIQKDKIQIAKTQM